jgi:transcriptional regulator of acetoin/glycerol metabolism
VEAARTLLAYSWPFNVRELVHALAHAVSLARRGVIEVGHLPPAVAAGATACARDAEPEGLSSDDAALRKRLSSELERHRGNVSAVARSMGKATIQIYRVMQRVGIDPKTFR